MSGFVMIACVPDRKIFPVRGSRNWDPLVQYIFLQINHAVGVNSQINDHERK